MRFVTPNVNVEVKYKKINPSNIVQAPATVMRNPATGNPVNSVRILPDGSLLTTFKWRYQDAETGEDIANKDIQYFKVNEDGSEQRVRPFTRTAEINIVKEAPAPSMNGFLVESYYELYHTDESCVRALYKEAERYFREDLVGIALFSWGNGFKQFYAIVYPIMRDGRFVWVMKLTQAKLEYSHLMDVPAEAAPVEEVPTLEALPTIDALITA